MKIYIIRTLILVGFVILGSFSLKAQTTYPYHFKYDGNPLVRNHGAADPDVHVWDDTVWMYCSQDHEIIDGDTYATMDGYHAFSSPDMINWTDHGEVLHSKNVSWGVDGYMWAPGAARKNGKYYLYYPHRIAPRGWRIGVALSDRPEGPFTDIGYPIEGITGIDPAIFIDDDGEAYIYNGSHEVAKLKTNMIELAEPMRKVDYAPKEILDDETQKFHEGSYMHKRNGVYYFSYSNFKNEKFGGYYAMGDNPYGPFEWKGPMAIDPNAAQDHHSIIQFKDQWYYFYHIALPNIPANKEGQGRIASFERLYYNHDGTIQMVGHSVGPSKNLTTNASNGYILLNPPGGAYSEVTEVTLTVSCDLGYAFRSWSGALAGTGNPNKIIIDSDKSVTASFVKTPTYTLSVSSNNGIVLIDPPGGVYNSGDTVSLIPVDDFGFDFTEWTGDYSGIQNPAKVVMDADKSITANFASVEIFSVITDALYGSIELNPPGGRYEKGTVVNVTPKAYFGYEFSNWGNQLSGNKLIEGLVVDSDINVSAHFKILPSEKTPWQEDFSLPDNTKSDAGNNTWSATRPAGIFEVRDNHLVINDEGGEGIFSTGVIDISKGPVDISLDLWSAGDVDPSDYVKLYKVVDSGSETLIGSIQNRIEKQTIKGNASGQNLVLVIRTKVTSGGEYYHLDNLSVNYSKK